MAKSIYQPSFNAGVLSDKLKGRHDLKKYYSGTSEMENMIPLIYGGAAKRSGTYMVAEANDTKVRVIPFEYSVTQAYVIEMGSGYMRFYKEE